MEEESIANSNVNNLRNNNNTIIVAAEEDDNLNNNNNNDATTIENIEIALNDDEEENDETIEAEETDEADEEKDGELNGNTITPTSYETSLSSAHSYLHLEEQNQNNISETIFSTKQLQPNQYVILPMLFLRDVVLFPGDQMPFCSSSNTEHVIMKEILEWKEKEILKPRRILDVLQSEEYRDEHFPPAGYIVRNLSRCFVHCSIHYNNMVGVIANVYSSGLVETGRSNAEDNDAVVNNDNGTTNQVNIIARASNHRILIKASVFLNDILQGSSNDTNRFALICGKILPNQTCVNRPLKTKYITRVPEFAWKIYDSKLKLKNIYELLKERGMNHLIDNVLNRNISNNNYADDEEKMDVELVDSSSSTTTVALVEDHDIMKTMSTENIIWRLSGNLPLPTTMKIDILKSPSCIERLNIIESFLYNMKIDRLACNRCQSLTSYLTNVSSIFSMSEEGVCAAYVNPAGYIHQIITVKDLNEEEVSFDDGNEDDNDGNTNEGEAQGERTRNSNNNRTTRIRMWRNRLAQLLGLSETSELRRSLVNYHGEPTTKDSWFPGFAWTILSCNICGNHLGWKFDATSKDLRPQRFWGLRREGVGIKRA